MLKLKNKKSQALKIYFEGPGFRAVDRILGISYGTIYQWIKKLGDKTEMLVDNNTSIKAVELDEIHSYIGIKKLLLELDRCVDSKEKNL